MMLCKPTDNEVMGDTSKMETHTRSFPKSSISDQYVVGNKLYSQQYNHLYAQRLIESRACLLSICKTKWGENALILNKVIDCETLTEGHECILIGTTYKEMKLKPSVLDEFKDMYGISGAVQAVKNYSSESDQLVLEDESGRIRLDGDVMNSLTATLVTGVIIGVKGHLNANGSFTVNDVAYIGEHLFGKTTSMNDRDVTMPCPFPVPNKTDSYILLVSGLKIGTTRDDDSYLFAVQQLIDFVGGRSSAAEIACGIQKVIIAGNSVVEASSLSRDKVVNLKQQAAAAIPLKQFDTLLAQLLLNCSVDLIPGDTDPCSMNYPQQAFHTCLLPQSCRFQEQLNLCTNPFEAVVHKSDGKEMDLNVMGHSGKPLHDMALQTTFPVCVESTPMEMDNDADSENITISPQSYLKMLENSVMWGNLCPTAPDSLPCYPFSDTDPFILQKLREKPPSIVFSGNMPEFASSLRISADGKHQTKFVLIPSFHVTKEAVLVNTNTLDCHVIKF